MKKLSKLEDIKVPTNILTKELVSELYRGLTSGAKISHAKFSVEDFGQALSTIFGMNALTADTTMFNGTPLKEWEIPEALKGLLFSEVNLTGNTNQSALVLWADVTDYQWLSEAEMLDFSRRFYSTFRADSKTIGVADIKSVRRPIADFTGFLVLDEVRVVDEFVKGNFPIIPVTQFYYDYADGIRITMARQLFVDGILDQFNR